MCRICPLKYEASEFRGEGKTQRQTKYRKIEK